MVRFSQLVDVRLMPLAEDHNQRSHLIIAAHEDDVAWAGNHVPMYTFHNLTNISSCSGVTSYSLISGVGESSQTFESKYSDTSIVAPNAA
jgi:hypothetical protein